jgi:hypothetical protein
MTALQKLIKQFEEIKDSNLESSIDVDFAISLAKSLLEKEKEFALNLWGQYEKECIIYNDYLGDHAYSIDAIEWYDQTFNTKEK